MLNELRRATLLIIGLVVTITLALPCAGVATAATHDTPRGGSGSDISWYLDVGDELGRDFAEFDGEDPASRQYESAASGTLVVASMLMVHGAGGRARASAILQQPASLLEGTVAAADVADSIGVPVDDVAVTESEWTDVAGMRDARTNLATFDVEGVGSVYREVVITVVERGRDTALIMVMSVSFDGDVDVVGVTASIAARVRSGPPSAETLIAAAGVVVSADLPNGWEAVAPDDAKSADAEPESQEQSSEEVSGSADDDQESGLDSAAGVEAVARRIPQCENFVALLDVGESQVTSNGTRGSASRNETVDGSKFRAAAGQSTMSRVRVYESAREASGLVDLLREPAAENCLRKLYGRVARQALASVAPPEALQGMSVHVTSTADEHVGDEAVVYSVSLEIPTTGARLLVEQEYVRVGRAVGTYTFSTAAPTTVRRSVVDAVLPRFEAAVAAH